jgi:hypothetical protein
MGNEPSGKAIEAAQMAYFASKEHHWPNILRAAYAIDFAALQQEKANHCKDCCCARSWEALGVQSYTGQSIPEHITTLRAELQQAREEIGRLKDGSKKYKILCDALSNSEHNCLPKCDSYGHEDKCPVAESAEFIVLLQQQLAQSQRLNDELLEVFKDIAAFLAAQRKAGGE